MSQIDSLYDDHGAIKRTFVGRENRVPNVHKSVFSRFCQCGANVTIGLITDDAYASAEERWNSKHTGNGHGRVSRQEWLTEKLKAA